MIKLYEPSPTPASTWLMYRIWWAEFLLCHCFWLVTRLQQSLTYSASTRIQASRMAVPTLLQRTDGGAAMSMRSTRGCGNLAWQAPSGRPEHRRDLTKEGCCEQCTAQACSSDSTSSQGDSSLIRSTLCCMIVCTKMYEHIPVCTSMYEYVRVCISILRGCKYS